jgi:caffeoyl-CoA O-methyltransferase
MNQQSFEHVDPYIANLLSPDDPVLTTTEQSIIAAGMPVISISANQGKFLHLLALLCQANKILELGTLGGYSTIWMARALPPGGKLTTTASGLRFSTIFAPFTAHQSLPKTDFFHGNI